MNKMSAQKAQPVFVRCCNCDNKAETTTISDIDNAKCRVRYWCLECRRKVPVDELEDQQQGDCV